MVKYSQNELIKRDKIIESHRMFANFLNKDIINTLINLFDNTPDNYLESDHKIIKYIETERKERKLNNSNLMIESYVYGEDDENSTLFLIIKKNCIDFVHLSIHLSIKSLNSNNSGMIHIYKDVYKPGITKKYKSSLYALIMVENPTNRPNSLQFSIGYGYETPTTIKDVELYDKDVKKEMNIIISVLNKLFDETNKEYYVGIDRNISFIHNKTNKVLTNMNQHTQHITRQNVGSKIIPLSNNKTIHTIHRHKNNRNRKTRRRKNSRHKNSYNMLENAEL